MLAVAEQVCPGGRNGCNFRTGRLLVEGGDEFKKSNSGFVFDKIY
jgi:hypothetical protein